MSNASNFVSNRAIWNLAWPMIVSNLSVPLLGLVDTAVLGHLESAIYVGAVAGGSAILSFVYWGLGFIRMGTTGQAALALGGNQQALNRVLTRAISLAGYLVLVVLLLHPLVFSWGVSLMALPSDVQPLAEHYLSIRIISAPAVLINYAVMGWLIGRQRSRSALVLGLLLNVSNLLLDLLFVIGLEWNSAGAAWASVCADYLACGSGLWLVASGGGHDWFKGLREDLHDWHALRQLAQVNVYLFLRTLALLFVLAYFTHLGAAYGAVALAANAILMQISFAMAYALDGFANAAEALAGEAAGARQARRFMNVLRVSLLWSLVVALLLWLLFLFARDSLLALMTTLPDVVAYAREYYIYILWMPFVAVWSYWLDGVFVGVGQSRPMFWGMLVSLLSFLLVHGLLSEFGNHGIWLSFLVFTAMRGLTLGWAMWAKLKTRYWYPSRRYVDA